MQVRMQRNKLAPLSTKNKQNIENDDNKGIVGNKAELFNSL